MLKIYAGNRQKILQEIKKIDGYEIKYVEKPVFQKGLFNKKNYIQYFDYDNNFSTKEDVLLFEKMCNNTDDIIICIIENIDKRNIFYKHFSKQIIFFEEKQQNIKTIKDFYCTDGKDIVSILYKLYYDKQFSFAARKTIINILTGKILPQNIKQFFVLSYLTAKQ